MSHPINEMQVSLYLSRTHVCQGNKTKIKKKRGKKFSNETTSSSRQVVVIYNNNNNNPKKNPKETGGQ
jgi:hypothetical protein